MLVVNGKLITWETENQILEDQALYIEGEKIVEIGPQAELHSKYPDEEQIDARG